MIFFFVDFGNYFTSSKQFKTEIRFDQLGYFYFSKTEIIEYQSHPAKFFIQKLFEIFIVTH